jgi:hypothetical protein
VGGQHHAPATLPPGKTRYSLYRSLGGPKGQSGRVRKISPPPGFDPRTVQPVVSRYTDWATRPTQNLCSNLITKQLKVYSYNGNCNKLLREIIIIVTFARARAMHTLLRERFRSSVNEIQVNIPHLEVTPITYVKRTCALRVSQASGRRAPIAPPRLGTHTILTYRKTTIHCAWRYCVGGGIGRLNYKVFPEQYTPGGAVISHPTFNIRK